MKIFVFNHKLEIEKFGCVLTKKVGESYGEPKWFPNLGQASSQLLAQANYDVSDKQNNNIIIALKAQILRLERDKTIEELNKLFGKNDSELHSGS